MVVGIIGAVIGALILGISIFYLIKEKDDADSKKIYGIMGGVGAVLLIGMIVKIVLSL